MDNIRVRYENIFQGIAYEVERDKAKPGDVEIIEKYDDYLKRWVELNRVMITS